MSSEFFVVRRGSTSLGNRIILSGLSYEAIGLLMTELTLRPGTPLGYREMEGRGAGRRRIQSAHAELEAAGLRHRFLVRSSGGVLRTVTVVTDEPMTGEEALAEIQLADCYLVQIQSEATGALPTWDRKSVDGNGRHLRSSHRATENGARCEQGKQKPQTVRPVTDARSTAPRSDGAGLRPNTLRVINSTPPQTPTEEPAPSAPVHVAGEGRASRSDGASAPGGENPGTKADGDTTVVDRCLPEAMASGLSPRDRLELARMLEERVQAGWSEDRILAVLAARELPRHVRSLSALVRARLERDVPVDGAPPDLPGARPRCERVFRTSTGTVVPSSAIVWGDVTLAWTEALVAGDCPPEVDKFSWLSGIAVDRFVDAALLRRTVGRL